MYKTGLLRIHTRWILGLQTQCKYECYLKCMKTKWIPTCSTEVSNEWVHSCITECCAPKTELKTLNGRTDIITTTKNDFEINVCVFHQCNVQVMTWYMCRAYYESCKNRRKRWDELLLKKLKKINFSFWINNFISNKMLKCLFFFN